MGNADSVKLILLSDIHLDINTNRKDPNFTEKLVEYLSNQDGDVLVFTGDIAGNTRTLTEFFELTRELSFNHKFYVPGNHDIWVNQAAKDLSMIKYYEILPQIVSQYNWEFIPLNPIILDNTAFAGTMGWYDYSSRNRIWDSTVSQTQYAKKSLPNGKVELMDRHFVRFGLSDNQISIQMLSDLRKDIEDLNSKVSFNELDNLIVMSHMVPFSPFIYYRGILKYDFFTAYFGNFNLGNYISSISDLVETHAVFGQTHIPNIKQLSDQLYGYCVPIGYPREYGYNIDLTKLFSNRIIELEI